MRLTVENATHFRERDLRRFLLEALKRYRSWAPEKRVEVYYARRGGKVGGWGWYPKGEGEHPRFALGLPKLPALEGEVLVDAALTIAHELGHNRGFHHGEMRRAGIGNCGPHGWAPSDEERARAEWARAFRIEARAPRAARPALRAQPVEQRLEHARQALARATTRRKRAETIEKKWRRRLRALERRAEKGGAR
jgi:hypothetical protein